MVEHTRRSSDGGKVTILKPVRARENIASRGSEALEGEVVLEPGRHIGPAEIAVMATFGYTKVRVWKRPNVAILSTGDELVEVDQEPRPDQIRNSNAYCLASELKLMDLEVENLGIVRDKRDDLRQKMILGLEKDVMIITGGVSMGEYDLVEGIFRELGLEILFSKVAIKPGKPTVFARKENKLVFGLPGNPVSALVTFEYFVRPALCRLCGMARPQLPIIKGELLADLRQSAPGRTAFLPARVSWEGEVWKIQPIPLMSSADVVGFSRANATVMFPCDSSSLSRGEIVQSMLLPDFFVR
jgi:molybdopterin molybdotransferase